MKKASQISWVLVGVSFFALSESSHSTLLGYEGFNYANNSQLNGQSGGSGWVGNWSAGNKIVTQDVSLVHPASPSTTGGHFETTNDAFNQASRTIGSTVLSHINDPTGLWFSVLASFEDTTSEKQLEITQNLGGGRSLKFERQPNFWRVNFNGNSPSPTLTFNSPVPTNHMFVFHLFNTGGNNYQWDIFNPAGPGDVDASSLIASTTSTLNALPGNESLILKAKNVDFDEIRYGELSTDVAAVPEPASLAALSLGALGMLRRRKRVK